MNIRKVAEMCGVSVSTVSRILNNKPDVRPETREKVINMMNEMAFRPAIASNRHETICVVTPTVALPEFMGELMSGMMEAAYALGKNLTLMPMNRPDAGDITHFCRTNGLCGMLVINPPLDSRLPQALVEHAIPHVIIAASYPGTNMTWVDVDNQGGSRESVNQLFREGHRRIALFHGRRRMNQCEEDRIAGYIDGLQSNGLEPDARLMREITTLDTDLSVPARELMALDDPPTAIYCTTHRKAFNLLNALKEQRIKVPDDISLIGFGDYEVNRLLTPPMTSVYQPIAEMGRSAVQALEAYLERPGSSPQQITLPTRVVVRQSTRVVAPEKKGRGSSDG